MVNLESERSKQHSRSRRSKRSRRSNKKLVKQIILGAAVAVFWIILFLVWHSLIQDSPKPTAN